MLRVVFDDAIFTAQIHGGASRAFAELAGALAGEPGITPLLPFPLTANRHLVDCPVYRGRLLGRKLRLPGTRTLIRRVNRRAVRAALARGEGDVLHATWYDAALADAAGDMPLVLTVHDMIPEIMPEAVVDVTAAGHGDKLALLRRASRVIAVSEASAADLCRIGGLPRESVRVIHHGIGDRLRWRPGDSRPPGLPDRYLLFVGQRGGYKNFAGIAAQLALLLRRNTGLHLVCAGGGPLGAQALAPFTGGDVARRVCQIAADDRLLAACYAHAAAFVFPSLYEGFGMPLLEAMVNGCPVVCSNGGALPEIGAEAALYFDPAEPDALVEHIEALGRDAAMRQALIARGTNRVADFSWRKAAATHAALYRELV